MKPVIEIKHIGKRYTIRHQKGSYLTLRDSMVGAIKKPINYLRRKLQTKESFWALKDVSFEVHKGEVIGIIGKNGAGKSTLLKILSQITPPTEGSITIRGSVGSLLEVGTGFHPELTGRENIFLNGAILGMKKSEVVKKFNDIVSFAGIEQFLDTPVKYYSSGMYVRLAFSVAAHMEPDILIIDEVLAVGDADFQKKCLGKMEEITKKEGRTILFVSHNMLAVKELCNRCVLLSKGGVELVGDTETVINAYLRGKMQSSEAHHVSLRDHAKGMVRFTDLRISNTEGRLPIKSHEGLRLEAHYDSDFKESIGDVRVVATIKSMRTGETVLRLDSEVAKDTLSKNISPSGTIVCQSEALHLAEGTYTVDIDFLIQGTSIDYRKDAITFDVETDITYYGYTKHPDTSVCDRVIPFTFS